MKPSVSLVTRLLTHVADGQPVDMRALAQHLIHDGHHFSMLRSLFHYNHSTARPQIVQILDQVGFDRLRQKYQTTAGSDRINAALAGDSHRAGVSGCFAIIDNTLHDEPLVCLVREGESRFPRSFGKELVVVENEELMLQKESLITFLATHCGLQPSPSLDLLLGGGNRAASAHYAAIYRHYERVWFLLDVDIGGLVIFKNALWAAPDGVVMRFLIPDNIEQLMTAQSRRDRPGDRLTPAHKRQLEQLAQGHDDLSRIANLIRTHNTQLEQEVYLATIAHTGPQGGTVPNE